MTAVVDLIWNAGGAGRCMGLSFSPECKRPRGAFYAFEDRRPTSLTARVGRSPPKRRSRRAKSDTAAARSSPVKSGHGVSLNAELGVGRLPQQEIAQALLAARADEEIDVGHVGRRAGSAAHGGRERLARCAAFAHQPLGGEPDRLARGVVDREPEMQRRPAPQWRARTSRRAPAAPAPDDRGGRRASTGRPARSHSRACARRYSSNSRISPVTSAAGRCQLSAENA